MFCLSNLILPWKSFNYILCVFIGSPLSPSLSLSVYASMSICKFSVCSLIVFYHFHEYFVLFYFVCFYFILFLRPRCFLMREREEDRKKEWILRGGEHLRGDGGVVTIIITYCWKNNYFYKIKVVFPQNKKKKNCIIFWSSIRI